VSPTTYVDPETKRAGMEKLFKFLFVAGVSAATASIAWYAVEGLIGWITAAVIYLCIVNFTPSFSTWMANKRIAVLKAVIEANPIETMQNLYADKLNDLSRAEGNITDFETELGSFRDKVQMFERKYPKKAEMYQKIQAKMEECLAGMRAEHASATRELAQFKDRIEEAEALFEMAKAANKMLEKSQTAQQAVYQQIKEQVSFDTVRNDLNRAFANLNTAIERRKNSAFFGPGDANDQQALPAPSDVGMEITTTPVKELVRR
jgi:hypothetical protein